MFERLSRPPPHTHTQYVASALAAPVGAAIGITLWLTAVVAGWGATGQLQTQCAMGELIRTGHTAWLGRHCAATAVVVPSSTPGKGCWVRLPLSVAWCDAGDVAGMRNCILEAWNHTITLLLEFRGRCIFVLVCGSVADVRPWRLQISVAWHCLALHQAGRLWVASIGALHAALVGQ